jgi:hypothetical protein
VDRGEYCAGTPARRRAQLRDDRSGESSGCRITNANDPRDRDAIPIGNADASRTGTNRTANLDASPRTMSIKDE